MTNGDLLAIKAAQDGVTHLNAGVAAFDVKSRLLLLRQAPGRAVPGLWELPSTRIGSEEPPERAARRALREETGLSSVKLQGYAGQIDHVVAGGLARQLVFIAFTGPCSEVTLSAGHDGHLWRHADALPAIGRETLRLIRRIAPPKPQLEAAEWQHSLPRWHVGANALVRDQTGRILIVRPARSRTFQLPGGQVDAHETPPDAAGRELYEETGLRRAVGPLLAISFEHPSPYWDHPTQIMLFDFGVVDSATTQIIAHDPEIAEHRWAHPGEAEALLGPARTERLRAGIAGLGQGHPVLVTTTEPEI